MTDILDKIPEWISWLFGLLGIGTGGVFFFKSKKLKSDSEARIAKSQAELEEANVYKSRIKSLGEEVSALETKVKNLRAQLEETENQRNSYMSLCGTQEVTIEQLKLLERRRSEENEQLKKENRALKSRITKMEKRLSASEEN